MSEIRKSNCKGCGKKIIWGITKDGKAIPLDASAPVYSVTAIEYPVDGGQIVRIKRAPELERHDPERIIREHGLPVGPWLMAAYVSHFCTCPKANEFSANVKKVNP